MNAQQIMKKLNTLQAKRDQQKHRLQMTEDELHYWEVELEKIKKGK